MEQQEKSPAVKINRLAGIDLRNGRHALSAGSFDRLWGMYPSQTGLLSRIPGKFLYRYLQGRIILGGAQTFDGSGNFIIQNGDQIDLYTMDDFLNRSFTPSITQTQLEEESYGVAYILHDEANTVNGGSAQGFQSGPDTTSNPDTFYGRRLTAMPVNQTVATLLTVNTFNAATGGGGSASVAGNFVLVPGTYRITAWMTYCAGTATGDVVWGLYNTTSAAFEVDSNTTVPILGNTVPRGAGGLSPDSNFVSGFDAHVTVISTNKTYEIRHKGTSTGMVRPLTFCGNPTSMTGANVNAGAARNTYGVIQIIRFS